MSHAKLVHRRHAHRHDNMSSSDSDDDHHDSHEHSHSILHPHSHDHDHGRGTEKIVDALKGNGDAGSRVTLIGLVANIGLVFSKFSAGWAFNSASLIADAGHSLSDLLGDFVTLVCWKLSRQPPSARYPHGYGKFETLGTASISLLLIGGALGIGFHSYTLLIDALAPSLSTLPAGSAHDLLEFLVSSSSSAGHDHHGAVHAHSHGHGLDPNAAWFALASIVCKEWLYRITRRVATQEKSPVLHANALHHRSDAYTSVVALFAILGNWYLPGLPLDPLGGILVSILIIQQSIALAARSVNELMDVGVSAKTIKSLERAVASLTPGDHLVEISDIRAVRAGSLMFVDLVAHVKGNTTVHELEEVEKIIRDKLVHRKTEIREVRIQFRAVESANGADHTH